MTVTASALLLIAAGLVVAVDLPHRADYTGQTLPQIGAVAPEVGAIAPPFQRPNQNGETVDLLDLRGQLVIINFWATWCVPCAVEMPELQDLYEQWQDDELRIIGVNLGETPTQVAAWADDHNLTFDLIIDTGRQIETLYRLRGQPSTYIIAPDGTIADIFFGPTTQATLHQRLLALTRPGS